MKTKWLWLATPSVRYLGRFLDRPGGPRGRQNGAQRRPKSDLKIDAKNDRMLERSQDRLGAILGRSWCHLGARRVKNQKKVAVARTRCIFSKKNGCGSRTGHGQPPFSSHSHLFRAKVHETLTTATFFVTAGPGTPACQSPVPRNPPEPLIASSVWGTSV